MSGNWADDLIAGPMGFSYCILFPRAREAIKAWTEITHRHVRLPTNVCPVAKEWAAYWTLHEIDETGLAPGVTTQLYGYREVGDRAAELDLDPLMTGYFDKACATSSIISFGHKKMIDIGAGGAFLTQDQSLAEEMDKRGYFPRGLAIILAAYLKVFPTLMVARRDKVALWDRHLGDILPRIKREQIVPWRVMRLAAHSDQRRAIVKAMRREGFDVGINYPALPGADDQNALIWETSVLNFFVSDDYDEPRIKAACEVIKRAIA